MQTQTLRMAKPGNYSRLWLLFAILAIAICLFPIKTGITRKAELASLILLWLGATLLSKRKWPLVAIAIVPVLALTLPGRTYDRKALKDDYLRSLKAYTGAKYVWGGENSIGIDCSGLIRQGLVDANWHQGLLTLNPALLRNSLNVWWHDCSADELGKGYSGQTSPIFESDSIAEIKDPRLQPGDIAVTEGGAHVLAYLGDKTWIEADPDPGRVVVVKVGESDNGWLRVPVSIHRWNMFTTGT